MSFLICTGLVANHLTHVGFYEPRSDGITVTPRLASSTAKARVNALIALCWPRNSFTLDSHARRPRSTLMILPRAASQMYKQRLCRINVPPGSSARRCSGVGLIGQTVVANDAGNDENVESPHSFSTRSAHSCPAAGARRRLQARAVPRPCRHPAPGRRQQPD